MVVRGERGRNGHAMIETCGDYVARAGDDCLVGKRGLTAALNRRCASGGLRTNYKDR